MRLEFAGYCQGKYEREYYYSSCSQFSFFFALECQKSQKKSEMTRYDFCNVGNQTGKYVGYTRWGERGLIFNPNFLLPCFDKIKPLEVGEAK